MSVVYKLELTIIFFMDLTKLYFERFEESQKAMAASIESLDFCKNLIHKHSAESILDAGSGLSSLYFHKHFDTVTTVDDNEDWAKKTTSIVKKELDKTITVGLIDDLPLERQFDFVFYDYGDIETRIFHFKRALSLTRRCLYIDDIHVPFFRSYIESRSRPYTLKFIPQTVDEFGRYGALLIKE